MSLAPAAAQPHSHPPGFSWRALLTKFTRNMTQPCARTNPIIGNLLSPWPSDRRPAEKTYASSTAVLGNEFDAGFHESIDYL